jgi:hypothetical protein
VKDEYSFIFSFVATQQKKQSTSPNGTIKACSACVVAFKKSYQIKIHFAIISLSAHRKSLRKVVNFMPTLFELLIAILVNVISYYICKWFDSDDK